MAASDLDPGNARQNPEAEDRSQHSRDHDERGPETNRWPADATKPVVNCPWSQRAKQRRLREIEQLVDNLPPSEVAVYEDEVDIHLNPKIGPDWMVPGQQKRVLTPGQNEKRYLAGVQHTRTGELIWLEGQKKNSFLFIRLLWELTQYYRDAKVIHVILENYAIHSTAQVEVSLASQEGRRIRLHFCRRIVPITTRSIPPGRTCMTTSHATTPVPTWQGSYGRSEPG